MSEVWKDIPEFEGSYQVSSEGNVRCLERSISRRNKFGIIHEVLRPAKELTQKLRGSYLSVRLFPSGKNYSVHRLVALAFHNKGGYDCVNHIDEDKLNNFACNLEWCTASYNQRHSQGKPITLIRVTDGVYYTFKSIKEASEMTTISLTQLWRLTKDKCQQSKGWRLL